MTEQLNRNWYEKATVQVVTEVQRQVFHPVHRWMAATLDGRRQAHRDRQTIIDELYGSAAASGDNLRPDQNDLARGIDPSCDALADQTDDLNHAFVRLSNLPTYPLDRLSRYEATLWPGLSDFVCAAVPGSTKAMANHQALSMPMWPVRSQQFEQASDGDH